MVRVRINNEYKVLERYCGNNRGAEWICVRSIFNEYGANVWEIWVRYNHPWKTRVPWEKIGFYGSWAKMAYNWESYTGQIVSYANS